MLPITFTIIVTALPFILVQQSLLCSHCCTSLQLLSYKSCSYLGMNTTNIMLRHTLFSTVVQKVCSSPCAYSSMEICVCIGDMCSYRKQVFRVKKNSWGANGVPKTRTSYLLVMVSTFVMLFSMDPLSPRMTPGCITQK